jgi:hypothetical protein
MGKTEKVTVTLDHMMRGEPSCGNKCAIALAVTEHFAAKFPGTRWECLADEHGVGVLECDSGTDQWNYTHNAKTFVLEYDGRPEWFDDAGNDITDLPLWACDTVNPFELELYP